MKPHKHAELIKAWADGATIQAKSKSDPYDTWDDIESQHIYWGDEDNWFRIKPEPKPEPKPDVVKYVSVTFFRKEYVGIQDAHARNANLAIYFDGETGELKSAEVIK